MTVAIEALKQAWRDYVVDGVPASGENEPEKSEIRSAFDLLETELSAIGAGILRYETKALLDANVTAADGQLAYVWGDVTPANNSVYQSDGGVWAEATWYFDAVADVVQPLVDAAEAAQLAAETAAAGIPEFTSQTGDAGAGELNLTDDAAANNIIIRVTPERVFHRDINDVRSKARQAYATANLSAIPTRDPAQDGVQIVTEHVGFILDGQSLMAGVQSLPLFDDAAALSYAKMFAAARPQDAGTDTGTVYAALNSLIESAGTSGGSPAGVTPATGMAMMMRQLLEEENGADIAEVFTPIVSVPAEGGAALLTLASGIYLTRKTNDITFGKSLSTAADKSYMVGGMAWQQGQSDIAGGVANDRAAYAAALRALRIAIEDVAQAQTGFATRTMPLLIVQIANHPAYGATSPNIALAQLDAGGDAESAVICPDYFLPRYKGDQVHLTPDGSVWQGAYLGLGFKRWLVDGFKPQPLQMGTPLRDGNDIIVPFSSPMGGRRVVIDTDWFATAPTGAGFTLDTGVALTASPAGPWHIRLKPASAVSAGAKLRYGWAGTAFLGYGTIRDDAGDRLVFDREGLALPMHNWLPIQDEVTLP